MDKQWNIKGVLWVYPLLIEHTVDVDSNGQWPPFVDDLIMMIYLSKSGDFP